MNHQELVLFVFNRDDLKLDSLEIIPEEDNSLVDTKVHPVPAPLDDLESTVLNDVQRPLSRDPMLRRRSGERDSNFLGPSILSDRIAKLRVN